MQLAKRKRGLFGGYHGLRENGGHQTPGYGGGVQEPEREEQAFFGKGGAGRAIAGTLGDVLLQRNGMGPVYAPAMQQQQYRQMEAEKQADALRQKSLDRQQGMADWQYKQQWERDNPKPVNNDTINDFEWYKGLSEADRETYHKMKPQYMTVDNGDGTKSIIPVGANGPIMGGAQQNMPSFTDDDWNAAGGPQQSSAGRF